MNSELYELLGLHKQFGEDQGVSFLIAEANGRSTSEIALSTQVPQDKEYKPCPEAFPGDEIPKGEIIRVSAWGDSKVFPGTTRDIAIYKPADLAPGQTPSLLVCFDGSEYLDENGAVRAASVLDSLIAANEIPPTLGVFVNSGLPLPVCWADLDGPQFDEAKRVAADQRSLEYDSLNTDNARFVIDELLPLVSGIADVAIGGNPAENTICGMSSGGIAAFTVAWNRPDIFGKVLSHCGSYVNLRGGHNYPYLVRTTERKAIKVYLQSGAADADITFGSWPLANQQMAAALKFAGYDYHFEFGKGGHTLAHAGSIFADSLRWLTGSAGDNLNHNK